jgi:hypothetical protein
VQRKIKNVIVKRIKHKRRFVKLFELNSFVTLLQVYGAYGKTKNILHIYSADGKKLQHAGIEPNNCNKTSLASHLFRNCRPAGACQTAHGGAVEGCGLSWQLPSREKQPSQDGSDV